MSENRIVPGPGAKLAYIFIRTLYKVTSNSDLNEGRGQQRTIGWFFDRPTAEKAAKGRYVMGSDCPIEAVHQEIVMNENGEIFLLGKHVEITYEDPRDVRSRALAKLTPDERKALGI